MILLQEKVLIASPPQHYITPCMQLFQSADTLILLQQMNHLGMDSWVLHGPGLSIKWLSAQMRRSAPGANPMQLPAHCQVGDSMSHIAAVTWYRKRRLS